MSAGEKILPGAFCLCVVKGLVGADPDNVRLELGSVT
jgi:hypothetical protein